MTTDITISRGLSDHALLSTHVPFVCYDIRLHLHDLRHFSCKETPPHTTHTHTILPLTHHLPISTTTHDRDHDSGKQRSGAPAVKT
jgi:hypothetical protein